MSKYYLLIGFLLALFSIGCEDKKEDKETHIEEEIVVKDLNYHLSKALEEIDNIKGVEQKLTDDVYLRSFAFYEKDKNHYNLILELQDDITKNVLSKYTFAVEGFVTCNELVNLSDYAKRKNRTHDAWFGNPSLINVNNRCYVILDVKTKLRKFDLIKFYLYDSRGYKGDIGDRVLIYNYKI